MDPATAAHITNLLHRLSVGTNVQAPVAAGFFECPSCHTIHPLTVAHTPAAAAVPAAAAAVAAAADVAPAAAADVAPAAAAAAAPAAADVAPAAAAAVPAAAAAVPNAAVAAVPLPVPLPAPEHPPAGSNPNGPWYAVVTGRQVGVFQDWRRVVAPLVLGVPHWDSQRFSTYAQARRHYNDLLAAGLVHVHHE